MRIALVINNSNIKILATQGKRVKKWGSQSLKAGLVRDGLILQPPDVAAAIDDLLKSTKVRRERAAVSLAGLSFTYRFLGLPRMKPALQEEAIMRAARKEMSLPLEELYLSWQPVPGKGDEQSFFVLGVPRNPVDAAVQTLNLAGIEPYTMELHPLALARAANRRDAIVVSLEPDIFDIVFIADGIPGVIHTIGTRGEGATLEDNIRRLVDELNKTTAFYQSSHPESHLSSATPLLLTGDLALDAPASALLQAEVEYPVEPLVPPVEFHPGMSIASFAASSGLALNYKSQKSAGRNREGFYDININILTGKYRKSRPKPLPAFQVWLGIFLVLAILLLYPFYQTLTNLKTENASLEEELRVVNRELGLASLVAEETLKTEEHIRETIESTEALKTANLSIIGDRGSYAHDLEEVTAAQPPVTSFMSIEINHSRIIVRGETDSVFTVVNYATALEALPFQEVRISELDEVTSTVAENDDIEIPATDNHGIVFEIIIQK